MPKNVSLTDKQTLFSIPLPNHGGKYAVVSHKFIVDEVLNELQANNLVLIDEVYKMNLNGEIAQGIYKLEYNGDPELGLVFAWSNSYDKTMRFKCSVGTWVKSTGSCMLHANISNYGRKHINNAQQDVVDHIKDQLLQAKNYYQILANDKETMKNIFLKADEVGALLGVLFYTRDVITSSQLILIKDQTKKILTHGNTSLWGLYNVIIDSLRSSHPKTWMEQQKGLHDEVRQNYILPFIAAHAAKVEEQLPGQTNLLDQIEEAENKTISFNPEGEIVEKVPLNDVQMDWSDQDLKDFEAASLTDFIDDEPSIPSLDDYLAETTEQDEQDSNRMEEQAGEDTQLDEGNSEFPNPPSDIPVYIPATEEKVSSELEEVIEEQREMPENQVSMTIDNGYIPLHEQVASEEVLPVSQEEKMISQPPIVNKEDEIVFQQPSLAEEIDFDFEKPSTTGYEPTFEF